MSTAVSQLIEAVGKLVFGLLLARIALQKGMEPPKIAAAAGWGLTLGSACATLYLFLEKLRFDRREVQKYNQSTSVSTAPVLCHLTRLAIPMTLGASAVSLTKLIDMTMILRRLQAIGFSEFAANEAYGGYTTLALSIYSLLPSLVGSIALPLIPILSSAIEMRDREKQTAMIRTSYHLTSMLAIPAALSVSAFAKPILSLLFGREAEAVERVAPLLSMLGVSIFLSCMITATNSVLHAYRSVNRPIVSMLAGAVVKIVSAYFLIGLPSVGMLGAPISTFACNLTVVSLNLVFAARLHRIDDLIAVFGKPFAASVPAVGIPFCLYHLLAIQVGESLALGVGALTLVVVLYAFFACILGVITAEDLESFPMGKQVSRLFMKIHLLRAD
jgi:stage V sporulation protein B